MHAAALSLGLRVPSGALRRALIAGIAWGVVVGVLIVVPEVMRCGVLCVTDAAVTLAISIAAGIVTLGPLAAFGHLVSRFRSSSACAARSVRTSESKGH